MEENKHRKIRQCQYCGKRIIEPAHSCEECMDDTGTMAQGPSRGSGDFDWARYDKDGNGARSSR